jgi:tripartite-type tricarboxylate transporter receptor subunit TctC
MKTFSRIVIHALCAVVLDLAGAIALAQDYPTKPVRLIVPFPPGGSSDFFARFIAPKMGEGLGQQVVVDNRGGAGGTIGTELASRAEPDGYTILLATANTAMNVSLYGGRSVDPRKVFAPVALLGSAPNILSVHPSLPAKSVAELVALTKARPGEVNYASGGSGSTSHLAAELFKTLANVNLVHVPYRGNGPALISVLSGETSVVFPPASVVLPHAKSGKLRALAIASLTRFELAPDLPTIAESGVRGYEAAQWYGLVVPTGTPRAIIDRLNRESVSAVQEKEMKAQLLKRATTALRSTSEEFGAYLRSEIVKWEKVVKFSGARVE